MPIPDKTNSVSLPSSPLRNRFARFGLLCAAAILLAALWTGLSGPRPTLAASDLPQQQKNTDPIGAVPATTTPDRGTLASHPSIWPVTGTITSGFGQRTSPFGGGSELHPGLDIAIHSGAPVVATADGRVVYSGPNGGYGNLVQIDHGQGVSTLYGHNSRLAVQVGETVKKGQVISYAGSTGRSTGPHVHYEVRENDSPVDPWKYLVYRAKTDTLAQAATVGQP